MQKDEASRLCCNQMADGLIIPSRGLGSPKKPWPEHMQPNDELYHCERS
uniref:Uncharacterized protein n=1 Tax=Arundo donax TaxID=35708 RepID=A0A0A9FCV7_ARUDO